MSTVYIDYNILPARNFPDAPYYNQVKYTKDLVVLRLYTSALSEEMNRHMVGVKVRAGDFVGTAFIVDGDEDTLRIDFPFGTTTPPLTLVAYIVEECRKYITSLKVG